MDKKWIYIAIAVVAVVALTEVLHRALSSHYSNKLMKQLLPAEVKDQAGQKKHDIPQFRRQHKIEDNRPRQEKAQKSQSGEYHLIRCT